jgi:hypothetical protein
MAIARTAAIGVVSLVCAAAAAGLARGSARPASDRSVAAEAALGGNRGAEDMRDGVLASRADRRTGGPWSPGSLAGASGIATAPRGPGAIVPAGLGTASFGPGAFAAAGVALCMLARVVRKVSARSGSPEPLGVRVPDPTL